MNKHAIITCLRGFVIPVLALVALTAQAQEPTDSTKTKERKLQVYAEVKDHLTHEYIKGVRGELLHAADSTFADSIKVHYQEEEDWKYSYIQAGIKQAGSYLIRLEADSFRTAYVPLEIKKMYKREQTRSLKTIYLRRLPKKLEVELGEVVVQSTKLKFYMDGDTLVYNADAFQMAEGSMLDALIKKLPGVELESGGVIKVNGRQVSSLLLNGKDFFDSDRELLLENMPTYMVKQVRSYERVPEDVKGTNREKTAQKELVMDVKLKREYNSGWIANGEGGGGTTFFKNDEGRHDAKYLGRLFGLHFSDRSRLAVYATTNNLNDYRTPGEKGEWSPLTQSEGLISLVKAGANFRTEKEDRYRYEGSISTTYWDKNDANNTSSATFLDDGSTYGRSFFEKRSYDWQIESRHRYNYYHTEPIGEWLKYFQMSIQPYFYYTTWNNHSESASVTLAEDVADQLGKDWMDSIQAPNAGDLLRRYAINRTISRTKGVGHWFDTNNDGYLSVSPAHNDFIDFWMPFSFRFTDRKEDNYEHNLIEYVATVSLPDDFRNRYQPTKRSTTNFTAQPRLMFAFDEKHRHSLDLGYTYNYYQSHNNSPLYLLNKLSDWNTPERLGSLPSMDEMLTTLDANNSSEQRSTTHTHTPQIAYRLNKSSEDYYSQLSIQLGIPMAHERLDYHRGSPLSWSLDTLMKRNTTFLAPTIYFFHSNWKRNRNIYANLSMSTSAPSMTSLLNIRDDSNPLYITLGNPNLKNTRNYSLSGRYSDKYGKTLFNVSASAQITENAVASGFVYDRSTGVRTVTPENVNGNWTVNASTGVDFPIDKKDRWRIRESVSYNYNHSVDLSGTTVATRSVVASTFLTDELGLTWKPTDKMEYGISGKLNYQHSGSEHGSLSSGEGQGWGLNAYTYQYGASAQVELPWSLQLSTDLTMYSRRGYSEPSMNTNELVWNARLAKRLMKGNLVIMFDGFDLLGNLSNVRRSINAQGRTETFYNVIPSYGLLHISYKLNKEPKKK